MLYYNPRCMMDVCVGVAGGGGGGEWVMWCGELGVG